MIRATICKAPTMFKGHAKSFLSVMCEMHEFPDIEDRIMLKYKSTNWGLGR